VKATTQHSSETRTPGVGSLPRTSNTFLTLPNLLSFARIALIVPFVIVVFSAMPFARLWACLIMALAALTDKLDGDLARKYHQTSEWGKILDPLADKICIGALVIVLIILRLIPTWLAVSLFARDLLILLGGLYLKARYKLVLPSNLAGKWTVGVIALSLFAILAGASSVVVDPLVWATLTMLVFSLALYSRQFLTILRTHRMIDDGSA
jgi:CDP-diacylglycerol--glycerol-3-phosphate 3-phosphatidyltransferase